MSHSENSGGLTTRAETSPSTVNPRARYASDGSTPAPATMWKSGTAQLSR